MPEIEKLRELVSNRGYTKASISRLHTFSQREQVLRVCEQSILVAKRDRLVRLFDEYEDYSKQILILDPEDKEDVTVYEDRYFEALVALSKFIRERDDEVEHHPPPQRAKLPSIEIPQFDGKSTDYIQFISLFDSVIHSDRTLDNVQKLHYLKTVLKGEPYDMIKNLSLTGESYVEAKGLLHDRYYNKFKLISDHINNLLDLGVMTKCTATNIREFVSFVKQNLATLKNLEDKSQHWDAILMCILTRKIDPNTAHAYQLERDAKKEPSVSEFLDFMEKRAIAMENANCNLARTPSGHRAVVNLSVKGTQECRYCKLSGHKIFDCKKFKVVPTAERIKFVEGNGLCMVCLNSHQGKCKFHFRCAQCKQGHNTLVHQDQEPPVTLLTGKFNNVLLPTARIKLVGLQNQEVHIKAVLDSASQVSLVTKKVIDILGLTPNDERTNIVGVGNYKNDVKYSIPLEIHSLNSPFKIPINCHVVDNITCRIPQAKIDTTTMVIPPGIQLADKHYNMPADIHMLIGAEIFFQILLPSDPQVVEAQRTRAQSTCDPLPHSAEPVAAGPQLLNTQFGYVVGGAVPMPKRPLKVVSLLCLDCDSSINQNLQRFWNAECVPEVFKEKESEQQAAENIFQSTVKLENNRFTVDLPLKIPFEDVGETLGNSFDLALYRFLNLEKKLHKNINLLTDYRNFIHEYVDLGHAHFLNFDSINFDDQPLYFLPHHAVINEGSKTTRTRVVFDGSLKTNKKISLNDIMLNGPTVQRDLFDIVLLYRLGEYAFSTDIQKMFRNAFINPEQTSLQNILWRDNPNEPIKCMRLDTITYGLKSSSYLATRCLLELANRYEDEFPLASVIIRNCTYVDDVLYSSTDLRTLIQAKLQLQAMLARGSFKTHKWAASSDEILADVPLKDQHFSEIDLQKDNCNMKALGLCIDARKDCFIIKSPKISLDVPVTKRNILSQISRFYDPLGFVSPIVVNAKAIMQELWLAKIGWDAVVPENVARKWLQFADSLNSMSPIYLNRNIPVPDDAQAVQLIGFADASSSTGYDCCIYLRVLDVAGNAISYLLCSRSRINPCAKPLTIPRLELNAALLLAKLMLKVYDTLTIKIKIDNVFLYTDSKIALAWIKTETIKLQAYVGNRVKMIQQLTHRWSWLYVSTQENPADFISRGMDPQELAASNIWWEGPAFLRKKDYGFDSDTQLPDNLPEFKSSSPSLENVVLVTQREDDIFKTLDKYSDLNKKTRVLARVLRFCHNIKASNVKIHDNFITSSELQHALCLVIRNEQGIYFREEISSLKKNSNVSGILKPLHPFIDELGILRVGGRLQKSDLPYSQRHPIILPKASRITAMIIHKEHLRLLHAGPKLLLASLYQRYWLINGIRSVKKITYKCLTCFRLKAAASKQLMGSLPRQRVTASRAFQVVGIDFAGPVQVKNSRVRRSIQSKGYICVYVCFATKAIHLELASDLKTETFLACFKRFISRRGIASEVFCDNAATFQAARNQLVELYRMNNSQDHRTQVQSFASQRGIKFHFTPSYSPVFAGLAEAGVKSMKYHLKRVVQRSIFTYEQLNTILTQVEAVLNSRPLLPVTSSSVVDFAYLTPGHFLIGGPLTAYPEPDLTEVPDNRLKFWGTVEKIRQAFWKVWHKHYLNALQSRPKWRDTLPNLTVGTLVLMKEPDITPLYWPVARVTKVFPGNDGHVRALDIVAPNGKMYRRSLAGICVLPLD